MGILGRWMLSGMSVLTLMLSGTAKLTSGLGSTTTGCTRSALMSTAGANSASSWGRAAAAAVCEGGVGQCACEWGLWWCLVWAKAAAPRAHAGRM